MSRISCISPNAANLIIKKSHKLPAAQTLNLSKFLAVHGLWASVLELNEFDTGAGVNLHCKWAKGP